MGARIANLASDNVDFKRNQSEEVEEDTTYTETKIHQEDITILKINTLKQKRKRKKRHYYN